MANIDELMTHWFEDTLIALVRNPILQWDVNCIALALPPPSILLSTGSREVLSKLVETTCHNAVGGVERLLDTIPVMAVNVDVEHARVYP